MFRTSDQKTPKTFKEINPFVNRKEEADRIMIKYPERVPVICEKVSKSEVPDIDKNKFLVPLDLSVGQFLFVVRKRISVPSEKAIFIFVNNTLPAHTALMSQIYKEHKDPDGFLYITYSGESTYG